MAFRQNWTCTQEKGHCNLISDTDFLDFDNSENQGPTSASHKFQPYIPSHSGEKVVTICFAIFSIGGHLGFSTRLNFIVLKP